VLSVYALKPRFQEMLRPLVRRLANQGITANQITVSACILSIIVGLFLRLDASNQKAWLLLPAFLFVRMALNAMDGMLAREFGQKSSLGAYLNELSDVISDAFLYLPFAYLPNFEPLWVGAAIVLAVIAEMSGTVSLLNGVSRRYDGPMGKSDRALVFGAWGLWIGMGGTIPPWAAYWFLRLLLLLLAVTIVNRVRHGLLESNRNGMK
jgi:CDP-diacylglycerol--glycerol-3-phosphate 3-phosphatidyltransferase